MIDIILRIYILGSLIILPAAGPTPGESLTYSERMSVDLAVYSPFLDADRQNFKLLNRRIVGRYGDWRSSYMPGHLHAGIDMKGEFEEKVYAIGVGEVMGVYGRFPNRSVIVIHQPASAAWSYSQYFHLEDIKVRRGDRVDESTLLGRLFTEEELIRSDFGTDCHVHLEIRKNLLDNGRASTHSMTRADLNRHCLDPLEFFRRAFNSDLMNNQH